ncbi:MAG: DUF4907 domain-containing protein [Edaphocola sp.]
MTNMPMRKSVGWGLTALLFFACNSRKSNHNEGHQPGAQADSGVVVSLKTYPLTDSTWGYSILVNDKEYIRQATLPAVQGNVAFTNELQAKQVGRRVLEKLKKHENPSLSPDEVSELTQSGTH